AGGLGGSTGGTITPPRLAMIRVRSSSTRGSPYGNTSSLPSRTPVSPECSTSAWVGKYIGRFGQIVNTYLRTQSQNAETWASLIGTVLTGCANSTARYLSLAARAF